MVISGRSHIIFFAYLSLFEKQDLGLVFQLLCLCFVWLPKLSSQSALVVGGRFITQTNLQNLVSYWNDTWYEIELLSSGERTEVNVVIEIPKGLLVAGKLKGERFSNIGLYDGMNWNTLNGGLKYEVISAAVDSKTNNIYVACTSENANALPLFRWSPSSGWTENENIFLLSDDDVEMFFYQDSLYIGADVNYYLRNNTRLACSGVTVWNTVTGEIECLSFPADGFVLWNNSLLGYWSYENDTFVASQNSTFIATLSSNSWQPFGCPENQTIFGHGVVAMTTDGLSLLFAANDSHVLQYNLTTAQWLPLAKQLKGWTYIEWLGILDQTLVSFGNVEKKKKIAFYENDDWVRENQTNLNEFRGWINVLAITSKNFGSLSYRYPPIHPFLIILIVALATAIVIALVILLIRHCKRKRKDFSIQEETETFLTSKSL